MTWLAFYSGCIIGCAVGICLMGLFSVEGEESRSEEAQAAGGIITPTTHLEETSVGYILPDGIMEELRERDAGIVKIKNLEDIYNYACQVPGDANYWRDGLQSIIIDLRSTLLSVRRLPGYDGKETDK